MQIKITFQTKQIMALLLALTFTVTSAYAADKPLENLDSYVEKYMKELEIPGVAVAVVKDGKTVVAKGYGTRTVGKSEPVNKDTIFAIASNSKYFTASALAVLVGENKLDWDDLMIDRLPGFQVSNDYALSHATIRDALAHRIGVKTNSASFMLYPERSRQDILNLMKYMPADDKFRASFSYNNELLMAAGEIIPATTGTSWDEFLETRFFKPLGMINTSTSIRSFEGNSNVATPHEVIWDGKIQTIPYTNVDNAAGAGSINSSAADMAKWLQFQLDNGKIDGESVIDEKALAQTRIMHNITEGEGMKHSVAFGLAKNFSGYGLGIGIGDSYKGHRIYSHTGGLPGMTSVTAFVPELKLGIVVLTNSQTYFSAPLAGWIIDRFAGAPVQDRIADTIAVWNQQKEKTAKAYKELLESAPENAVPILPLEAYAGTYNNEQMGDIEFRVDENRLTYRFGAGSSGYLEHLSYNTFLDHMQTPLLRPAYNSNAMKTARFLQGENGEVEGLIWSPLLAEQTFLKVDKSEKDK